MICRGAKAGTTGSITHIPFVFDYACVLLWFHATNLASL